MRLQSGRRRPTLAVLPVGIAMAMLLSAVGGLPAWGYACVYVAILACGWPWGWAIAGRNHPGSWIAGSLIGYGSASAVFWMLAVAGWWVWWTSVLAVLAIAAAGLMVWRQTQTPLVQLPCWRNRTTRALAAVVMVALLVMSVPYARVGETDADGARRYRAYFTADFVWHEALTGELAKGDAPPRNPYAGAEPLAYYWTYFMVPATVTRVMSVGADTPVPIDTYLKVNGLWSGALFISAVFLACWSAVPRAMVAALATGLTLVAASAEGIYAAQRIWNNAGSLAPLRELNVDAVTMWWFSGLTIDGLPRALWYNPQHSMACALGLIATVLASRLRRTQSPTACGAVIGLCLALGLLISPFPAGALALVVAGRLGWELLARPAAWRRMLTVAAAAGALLALGLWWCLASGMVAGAAGHLSLALSRRAMHSPVTVLGLAVGPILIPALAGAGWALARRQCTVIAGSVLGMTTALLLYFFVTLDAEPIWIGWRAGQVLLVTAPGAIALLLLMMRRAFPRVALGAVVLIWACIGLPTTLIDWYNAQDTSNLEMGPGFRWTVTISPAEQGAFEWIQRHTALTAIVQPSLHPRGRETWSVIPSFARRRMAAGLPISLMTDARTEEQATRVDAFFRSTDVGDAWLMARHLAIGYVFLGHVEQQVFPDLDGLLRSRPDLFHHVYAIGGVSVFAVLCQVPNACQ